MHKLKIEATKFTLVGAANFVLTFVVFTVMLKVLLVNYLLSLVAAWVLGMLFSYMFNFAWVFKPEQKIQFRAQFVKFFLASALSIALNMLVLRYIVEQTGFDPFYVQMALIPFIVVFNFLTAKFWSLKQGNKESKNILDTHKAKILRECLNRIDWLAFISIALIIIFGIALFTTYFFPIYPDEIQARFWLSRLPYDFPEKISGAPACLATFFQPVPSTMYLPSLINWAIHGRLENIPALRQVGFIVVFLWVSGLAIYLHSRTKTSSIQEGNQLKSGLLYLYVTGLFISIFAIGVLPLFLVTNRGEQLILPSVVLLVAVFLISSHLGTQGNRWQKTGLVILYFVSISLILFGHPKGLFLTPFFLIVGWQLFSRFKSRLPLLFATALLTLHIAQDFFALKYAFQCSEVPQFEAQLKSFSFDPISLFYDPRHFFDQAYQSVIHFPKYLDQLGFQAQTDISYLPSLPLTTPAKIANIFIRLNFTGIFCALLIFLPLQYYRKDILVGRIISINLALLTLFTCALIGAIFNLPKNWYDAGYFYSLLLIIIVFFIGENFYGIFQKPVARKIVLYLGVVALLSQAVFIQRYLPVFLGGYAGPSISIAMYDKIKVHNDLVAASRACNIDPVHSKKIVVDDYTYLYFQKSKWPMAITYILTGNDDQSIRHFFSKVDSDGLVVNCTSMFAPYMQFVKREGNVCCISKAELKHLYFFY